MRVPLNIFLFQDKLFIVKEDGQINMIEPPSVPKYEIVENNGKPTFVVGRGWKRVDTKLISAKDWSQQCRQYPFGYMAHLCTTNPEFMQKHAWKRKPRIMYMDIEVASDGTGLFPRAERNAVAMIGYKMSNSDKVVIIDNYDAKMEGLEDTEILKQYMEDLRTLNPDIIATYNGWKFDIPYLRRRLQKCNVEHDVLYWGSTAPLPDGMGKLISMAHSDRGKSNLISRLSYDIFAVDVLKDQKLMGLKNKKMKTLAKHFLSDAESDSIIELETGIKNIKAMMVSHSGKEELRKYLTSDVNITERLSDIYMGQNIEFAQRLNVPLGMIMSRTSGMIATLYMLRQMLKSDIIAIDANIDRYRDVYKLAKDNGSKKDFQGAFVSIYRTGKIKKLKKYDFSSLYPNIIRTLNLSYETVKFDPDLDIIAYRDETIINTDKNGTELILGIPDSVLNRTIVVHIDLSERGMVPKMLDDMLTMRSKIKINLVAAKGDQEATRKLDTQQWFLKVCANSIIGDDEVIIVRNGKTESMKIKDAETLYKQGEKLQTHALNKNKEMITVPIETIWSHNIPVGEQLYKIKLKNGMQVTTTKNHSIMFIENGKIISKKSSNISVGDKVVNYCKPATAQDEYTGRDYIILKIRGDAVSDWLQKQDFNKKIRLYLRDDMSPALRKNKHGEHTGLKIISKLRKYSGFDPRQYNMRMRRDVMLSIGLLESRDAPKGRCFFRKEFKSTDLGDRLVEISKLHTISYSKKNKGYYIEVTPRSIPKGELSIFRSIQVIGGKSREHPTVIMIDSNSGYSLGAYIAEGGTGKTGNFSFRGAVYQKSGRVDKNRVKKNLDKIFGGNHKVSKNGVHINTWFETFVLHSLFGNSSENKYIPAIICNGPLSILQEVMQGYFDGNGNYINNYLKRYTTISTKLASNIKFIMTRMGKPCTIYREDNGIYRIVERTGKKEINGIKVLKVEKITLDKPVTVYDICVPKNETFALTNGIISHNSAYGILSNRWSIGYLPIGITITGIGRYLITETIKFLKEKGGNDCIVEVDTDGIISTADIPVADINTYIKYIMETKFGIKINTLELEEEEFDAGYFYKMKNYIIKVKNGDVVKHGAYFKSSKACTLYRAAVDLIVDYAIHETISAKECKDRALNFDSLTIDNFMLSLKMSKNIDEYGMTTGRIQSLSDGDNFNMHATTTFADRVTASSSSLVVNLASKYSKLFGFTPTAGDVLEYVVVKSPITGKKEYEPLNVHDSNQIGRIDKGYYFEMVAKMLGGLLNTTEEEQESLELVDIWDIPEISGTN